MMMGCDLQSVVDAPAVTLECLHAVCAPDRASVVGVLLLARL